MAKGSSTKSTPSKYYVLDTNVLLHDSLSIFAFKKCIVAIPFVVLEELDRFKSERGELGRNARETIRSIDELREKERREFWRSLCASTK